LDASQVSLARRSPEAEVDSSLLVGDVEVVMVMLGSGQKAC
jgi:hypothetical protein